MRNPTLRAATTLLAALTILTGCPVSQAKQLDPQLCIDLGAGMPNYNIGMPVAAPGAPRPLLKRTLLGPDSHCNDGSPAVMYMRPAPQGSPDADKWVIHFEGGGNCADPEDCLDRFCSLGASPAVFDRAGKMSSIGFPDAIDHQQGMLAWNPASDFVGYNHVHLAYCSSDSYTGSAEPKSESGYGETFEIEFRGEAIVRDMLDTLRDGPTFADPRGAIAYYNEPMPDLDEAELVIFAGDSAGGTGMRHHLDRMADEVTSNNVNPGGVEVLGVVDAGLSPQLWVTGVPDWSASADSPASYDDMGLDIMRPRGRDFWELDDTALDESCMSSGVEDYYCMDTVYTVLNEITTPVFIRADLKDPLPMQRMVGAWNLFTDTDEYALYTEDAFSALPAGSGQHGTVCGQHVMIHGVGFGSTTTDGGTGLSWHDLLSNWVDGLAPSEDVQPDLSVAGPWTPSIDCP